MGPDYELKCPKCGGIIEHDDTYDTGYGEDYLVNYCIGHCIKCNAEFEWHEEFKMIFEGVKKFEEVS